MILPPLPEPTMYDGDSWRMSDPPTGFTEAQLLAYRKEVIEMCAKEMEGMKSYAGEDIAAELRSLK